MSQSPLQTLSKKWCCLNFLINIVQAVKARYLTNTIASIPTPSQDLKGTLYEICIVSKQWSIEFLDWFAAAKSVRVHDILQLSEMWSIEGFFVFL